MRPNQKNRFKLKIKELELKIGLMEYFVPKEKMEEINKKAKKAVYPQKDAIPDCAECFGK